MVLIPAHPRSRGENLIGVAADLAAQGSSPLTRGKPVRRTAVPWVQRLIPAHAGKTNPSRGAVFRRTAHPRSRGENCRELFHGGHEVGSSPLTRGKQQAAAGFAHGPGLIPAHAGKTTVGIRPGSRSTAHPRSRGENEKSIPFHLRDNGSSPLTRGKRPRMQYRGHCKRLIPAHAGKTGSACPRNRRDAAHPRSRGENCSRTRSASALAGSSPLTRGKRARRGRLGCR